MQAASSAAIWLVLLLAVVLANLPFVNERVFSVVPLGREKGLALRLLEMVVYGALVIVIGRFLEARQGQVQDQGWAFYAVLACVFMTLAFPGFVWRYLRRRH